ncbi:DNA circularization N-terminal domain-containing protein [Solirubrobacter ginsenosidimutans]|uniref:DNA circularization N-terminal domain-containing protein n=1 Tax=Solirubrobacter ginsenosidimutans TaxID=490573 RepID=A0A9X3N498_9ACTN|nr:DNA circularization N-terminal domain-containing protein [Solirubrobacter ginsenosidimutans]MDA0166833.1 DNA circularization N-terminal domain-containing protein [Solirubrobacter ginsenosidimutans]
MPVELAGITLAHLTHVVTREQARVVRHAVAGAGGDLSQSLGRGSTEIELHGIFYGADAPTELDKLRDAHAAGDPVELYIHAVDDSDVTQTLRFSQVIVAGLRVEQRAGAPDEFGFTCRVVEYVEPPSPISGDVLGDLDTSLIDEAAGAVDSVQNTLAEVAQLTDLLVNMPTFADPTTRLPSMLDSFTPAASDGAELLTGIRDLFGTGA